jgi:hypothetical protein
MRGDPNDNRTAAEKAADVRKRNDRGLGDDVFNVGEGSKDYHAAREAAHVAANAETAAQIKDFMGSLGDVHVLSHTQDSAGCAAVHC